MKLAHYVEMRVFVKASDDRGAIESKIREMFPFDLEKEKIEFKSLQAQGDEGPMSILTVFIKKERHTKRFLRSFFNRFNQSQREMLHEQLDTRLDGGLHFYIRLDKPQLLEGNVFLTDSGNCFHFEISVAAYPHKRYIAKDLVETMIRNEQD